MIETHYTYLISSLHPESSAKYYIGVRTSHCLPENDSYMGSSVHLRADVEKFGLISFEKIIIKTFNDRHEANNHEAELLLSHNARNSRLFYNKGQTPQINKQFNVKNKTVVPNVALDRDKPRPLCECGNTTAINYVKNGKTYYRKKCHKCIQKAKQPKDEWQTTGYIKQVACEKCGFRSKVVTQIKVIKVASQFKSICLNCDAEIKDNGWSFGLTSDN